MFKNLSIAILACLFSTCANKPNVVAGKNYSDTGKIVRIIRYHEDSIVKQSRQEPFVQNLGNLMGLPELIKGSEGLNIRIWIWNGLTKKVINIVKNSSEYDCNVIEFNIKKADTAYQKSHTGYVILIRNEWKDLQPKSGWKELFLSTDMFKIADLPTGKTSHEYKQHLTEMAYVQFEIGNEAIYRYYEYLEPSFYRFIDHNSQRVDDFLLYLQDQIGVEFYQTHRRMFAEPDSGVAK